MKWGVREMRAIATKGEVEYIPVYQPILDIIEGKIIGFEANMRGKMKGSEKEINYYELKKENIANLDFNARDKAITAFKLFNKYKLFVNATPEELGKPIFFEDIDLSKIVLEITEDSVLNPNDRERAHKRLNALREKQKLTIALDDVGSQLSNLDKIGEFKPDFLKIDKDVAKNEKLFGIIKGIISQPEYNVIIEGIEKREEFELWKEMGCRYIQGYYVSRPMKFYELTEAIATEELFDHIHTILGL